MSLIKSLLGRRQFFAIAGATSTSALAINRSSEAIDPPIQANSTATSKRPLTALMNGVSDRYSHILSPLKIGNVVLKNRLLCPPSTPYFLQGPENFPSEEIRSYYINLAKNGAGLISVRIIQNQVRKDQKGMGAHMLMYDLEDCGVQNYLDQMIEGIHIHGSKASASISAGMGGPGGRGAQSQSSAEQLQKTIESAITQAKFYQSHGFDGLEISVRGNQNMVMELCKAVKKAVPDMLTITEIFVKEPSITQHTDDMYYKVGLELDDAVKYAKQLDGLADIAMVRIADSSAAHPTTWNIEKGKPYTIRYAEAIKKSGAKIITAPGGGYQNLDLIEAYIAGGKTDMITMARAFICDPEYGEKMCTGRGEEVVPCILCNRCHYDNTLEGPWYSVCTVNPKLGITSAMRAIGVPRTSKNVAIIGGGPAGMKAAITAAERGHKVTLFEKDSALGGLLRHSDYSPYKWAMKDFKDYLVSHLNKAGVKVVLNTAATPDMIKAKGYDTIMVAVGAEPAVPKIPGADGRNVYNVVEAYSKEKSMGKNVVVICSGEFGVDAGMYLARAGHNVTMLTSEKELFTYYRGHYTQSVVEAYKDLKNFNIIPNSKATGISAGRVTYMDERGEEQSIKTDDVVFYATLRPKKEEALKFYGSAKQFFAVGDCSEIGGNTQKSIRSAFYAASQV
jgi:2,4-dienoyl-CoA reductase-like NADH-dependent reductase (Old Yellow Enzyme family)/thioredoxin reductase